MLLFGQTAYIIIAAACDAIFLFKNRLRCLQLSDGKAVVVGQKIAFPQSCLAHSA